jgi:hypothetical protein
MHFDDLNPVKKYFKGVYLAKMKRKKFQKEICL